MDGWKNAKTEKELKTDKIEESSKKSDVKLKRPLSREKNVASVPKAFVLQEDRTDGSGSSPKAPVLGVHKEANSLTPMTPTTKDKEEDERGGGNAWNGASASPDIRSRPGGRSVEVRGPNAASCGSQLHPGKPGSTTQENRQPDPVAEKDMGKPAMRFPAADVQERPAPSSPGLGSTAVECKAPGKPAVVSSTAETQENPSAVTWNSAPEIKNAPPKPAPRSPAETVVPSAGPKPALRTHSTGTADTVKPAPRSLIVKPDSVAEHSPRNSATNHPGTPNAPKPAPRLSASPRISQSWHDNAARMESRSNHQFIVDENVSVGSSSINIERPLSTENICRICHESDNVEPLISPCLCRGTLSLVHRTCLQHWLAESDSSSCELCRFIFITKRVPKYSVLGSVVAWIRQNRRQRKALLVDTLGMIAFVPFATLITYAAAALADGIEYQESPSWTDVTIRFAIVTFISMMTTIDVAYATYWMLRAQHHFSSWYSWYRRNSDVTLLPHLQQ